MTPDRHAVANALLAAQCPAGVCARDVDRPDPTVTRFSFARLEEAARCGLPRHTNSECLYCTTADTGSIGCVNDHQLAGILGVSHRQIYRYRKENLSVDVADRLAVVLGHHPAEIWDEWGDVEWTDDEEEVA